jgi:type II secretory pathway pseudopilin PulG
LRGTSGFTLIEALLAMALFILIATALATVLISAINSQGLSRQKTVAQQAAMDQIEEIRRMPYDDVGTVSGNPPGAVPGTQNVTMSGLRLTIVTQITYVNDPTPTSYATSANYKRVTVTVRRTNDNHLLTREVTYIAPPARAPLGGLGNAIVNVQVVDYGTNEPVVGATVDLATGPSAPRSDTTDSTGSVTFPALDPNPTSGADAYYDVTASLSGYVTLADDVPPGAAAHIQLAPGQTLNTAIRVYLPATIDVVLENADGSTYSGDATVTVSSSRGSESFAYSGSTLTIDRVNGELVVPSLEYTVSAQTSGGFDVTPVTQYVPDDYPNDLSSTFTLVLPPLGSLDVTVLQLGSGVSGATVAVSGNGISLTGTTNSSGVVSFADVPAGTGYSVTASYLGQFAAGEVDVTEGGTATLTLSLPDPGTVAVTVLWSGTAVNNASVTLSGGPGSISVTGTTNSSGVATFVNVPPGSGYTVSASKSGQTASQSGISVSAGGTASVTLNLPTGTLVATVNSGGVNQSGATVVLSGGPMGISVSGTTNGSGQVTFVNVPAGTGYTVTGSVGSASRSTSSSVTAGSTTNVTITLASLVVTVTSGGQTQASATVTLAGGPAGINVSGTTNGSGQVTFLNVPTGSGYTVTATKAGASRSVSVTISNGGNTSTVVLPSVTVTVQRSSGNADSGASVTMTGGPAGVNLSGTTNGSGQVTFFNVPAGSGYTIKAWRCSITSGSKSRTLNSITVANGTNNFTAQYNSSTCPP